MKPVRPTRPLSVSSLSMPHLSDLTRQIVRQIVHGALFSAVMLSAVPLIGFPLWPWGCTHLPSGDCGYSSTAWHCNFLARPGSGYSHWTDCATRRSCAWRPWEKKTRFLPLLSLCQSTRWNATHFPVKVGSWGFCCLFAYQMSSTAWQGFPPYWAKKVRNEESKVSLRCSYLIYLRRNIRVWQGRSGD